MALLPGMQPSVAPAAQNMQWNQFRGPNGSGVAESFRPPVEVDANQPAWETPVPAGHSSPVVWEGRVFLTGVTEGRLVTLALDARSGAVLWTRPAPEVPLAPVHEAGSPAASTPCVDARGLYVYFGSHGLLCYDHDGREQWSRPLPTPASMYGVSTSPIVYEDRLFLLLDDDANLPGSRLSRSRITAWNPVTGDLVWETLRPYNRGGWSTPVIWKQAGGTELAVLGNDRVYGYDAATGEEKWYVSGFAREPIAVPVVGNGRLHVSAAMQGGRGDVGLDPEPFWQAALQFDRDGDQRVARDEITHDFTWPLRPELPPGHPGFGIPLPLDPAQRRERQLNLFNRRDRNQDGFWTRDEFLEDMSVGQGRPCLAAVEPGGRGDVTATHVAWSLRNGIPEIPSPVFYRDRLYLLRDGGILSCVRSDDGGLVYRERVDAMGQYCASPIVANDHLYLLSAKGVLTVVPTGDAFSIRHQADLGRPTVATPALDRDTLYVRSADRVTAFR